MKCILVGSQSSPWLEAQRNHSPEERGWAGRWSCAIPCVLTCLEPGMQEVEALLCYFTHRISARAPQGPGALLGDGTASSAWAPIPIQLPVPAPHLPALLPDPLHYTPLSPPPPEQLLGHEATRSQGSLSLLLATHTTLLPSPVLHPETSI